MQLSPRRHVHRGDIEKEGEKERERERERERPRDKERGAQRESYLGRARKREREREIEGAQTFAGVHGRARFLPRGALLTSRAAGERPWRR